VIQKPLATSMEDAQAIMAAAHGAGARVFTWHGNRGYGTDTATRLPSAPG
jgi:predicted dehydrogenase